MAALPHVVEVLEQCRISPPPSSSLSTASLPLTYFDIFWVALPPSHRIFFYQVDHSSKPHFISSILPNIKHSLSLTLQHFFPLAANIAWPRDSYKPEILYTEGDSVTLIVAESSCDFHHLSGHHQRDLNDLSPLIPQLPDPNVSNNGNLFPVLALQVTLFPNKGICIGVTYHHAVGDGNAIMQFIRAWALVCRSQGNTSFITESLPSYERSIVKDPGELETKFLKFIKDMSNITKETFNIPSNPLVVPSDKVVATFVIRPSDIKTLKQWVLARLEAKNIIPPKHLSTFVLTCAYVWICLIKARPRSEEEAVSAEDPIEHFLFLVDCRARLDPPLPPTYFGNCIANGVAETKRSPLLEEDGVAIAASLIGSVVQNFDAVNAMSSSSYKVCPDRLVSVAGSPKLGAYDTDFGWGNPKKAEVGGGGAICLCESPSEIGAIEVGLARTKIEMDRFTSLFENTIQSFSSM